MANKGRWMERKAAQKRDWKKLCQNCARIKAEFDAHYEKLVWLED